MQLLWELQSIAWIEGRVRFKDGHRFRREYMMGFSRVE